jgi:hypothetical protein
LGSGMFTHNVVVWLVVLIAVVITLYIVLL